MPHVFSPSKRPANYSNCPLKKRPIKYEPEDEDSDTDLSRSAPTSPTTSTDDSAEPENLSTKPEDLRLKVSQQPPSISVVAGRVVPQSSSISPSTTDFRPYLQSPPNAVVSFPSSLPAPPPLKPSLGPLEPISLNNRVWSNNNRVSVVDRHLSIPVPSLRGHHHHRESISPLAAASYPRDTTATFHYYPTYQHRHGSSPPHISPPIALEQSYPPSVLNLKQEQSYSAARSKVWSPHGGGPHSPPSTHPMDVHQHYRIIEEVPRNYNGGYTTVKTEQMCFPSPAHSQGSSGSRDSVISHSSRSSTASSGSHSPIVPTNVNGSIRYPCPECKKSYSTFSGLSKHLQFHCSIQNKKQFICKHCEKVYVSLGALKMHIRTHTLPCKCNICGKAFSRPWLLQGHIRTHTGEKPFTCQHCNRSFADRSNLRAHLQTHSEVKKYSCKNCSKTFSRMSLLLKHEDNGCSSASTC